MVVPPIEGETQRVDIVGCGFVDVGRGDFRDRSGERHGVAGFIVARAPGLDGPGIRGVELSPWRRALRAIELLIVWQFLLSFLW